MVLWDVFSILGLLCAATYRAPQIYQLYTTKKADDLNAMSYMVQSCAYIFFLMYLIGTGKGTTEFVLCAYYVIGLMQNTLVYKLKQKYKPQRVDTDTNVQAV